MSNFRKKCSSINGIFGKAHFCPYVNKTSKKYYDWQLKFLINVGKISRFEKSVKRLMG